MEQETENDKTESKTENPVRERLQKTLTDRGAALKTVQAEVYTLSRARLIFNFVCGLAAVALLIVSVTNSSDTAVMLPCVIAALVLVAVTLVMYFAAKYGNTPMSYLQYSVKTKDGEYVFQAISRDRAVFFDGRHAVEYNKLDAILRDGAFFPELKNDFFVGMRVNMRVGKADTETFYGTVDVDGKTKKCKVIFKNGVLDKGSVGSRRIRYYAVNDTSEEFAVPAALKDAAKTLDVPWPDGIPGLRLKKPFDDVGKK